jgi:HAT1-interacting factor 1
MANAMPGSITEHSEDPAQLKAHLDDLVAQATAKYAVKEYRDAAELYSQGTEIQAQLNGEMSTDNAELYYLYGRCLYHVAVQNSDVLGAKVAGEKTEEGKSGSKTGASGSSSRNDAGPSTSKKSEKAVAAVAEKSGAEKTEGGTVPFFQFEGDDNWADGSDEEEEDNEDGEGAAEEEDDFSNAFEMLDLARVLLQRKLEAAEKSEGSSKETKSTDTVRNIKERLADTYDLQAEISLENEQFPQAATDLRSGLELKSILYPPESSLLAEAHYKLSLALEFSSVTQQKDEEGNVKEGEAAQVDEAMREEAAKEMEAAIASCRARIEKEEATLKQCQSDGSKKTKITREGIDDVKDMVQDMEQRVSRPYALSETYANKRKLVELRQPPVSVNDPLGTGSADGATPLQGILGQILGESPEAQKARLEEASKEAKDLTGLVKRKKPASASESGKLAPEGKGKRKADDEDVSSETSKKARVEDAGE